MKIEEGEGRDEEEFDLSLNYGSSVLDVGEAAPLGQRTCLEIHLSCFQGEKLLHRNSARTRSLPMASRGVDKSIRERGFSQGYYVVYIYIYISFCHFHF